MRSRFLSCMKHEFRTTLSGVSLSLSQSASQSRSLWHSRLSSTSPLRRRSTWSPSCWTRCARLRIARHCHCHYHCHCHSHCSFDCHNQCHCPCVTAMHDSHSHSNCGSLCHVPASCKLFLVMLSACP